MNDTLAERLAQAWLDKYAYGDDAVLARCEELVRDVAEECAKIVEGELHDGSPLLARCIRDEFGIELP